MRVERRIHLETTLYGDSGRLCSIEKDKWENIAVYVHLRQGGYIRAILSVYGVVEALDFAGCRILACPQTWRWFSPHKAVSSEGVAVRQRH